MKKGVITAIVIVIVIIAAIGGTLAISHKSTKDSGDMGNMDMPSSMQTQDQADTTPMAANSVTIQNYAFKAANITVKKGTKVTWTNQDSVQHDVVMDNGGTGPNSELLSKGETYSYTFDTVGTFAYHCSPHPYMKASVTVTE